jgi:carbonic anhydrase/acetyltransferase-like protein (isoleucine patch superfamily)
MGGRPVRILLDAQDKGRALVLGSRWKRQVSVTVLESGIVDLAALVEKEEADVIIICAFSSVCVFDPRALLERVSAAKNGIVKASIGKIPIEVYVARRAVLSRLLSARAGGLENSTQCREYLFTECLSRAVDGTESIQGRLFFHDDLMELYRNNLWLAGNFAGTEYRRFNAELPELTQKPTDSQVSERGFLKDSFIGTGTVVDGYAENSVLFPNVTVRSGSRIVNSVVMSNNRIGADVVIQNALVLPYTSDGSRTVNIGDRCSIGGRSETAVNGDFPDQIRDGLTLVGMNVSMPNGFRVEAGGYIAAGSGISELRRQKTVRRGASYIKDGG